MPPKPPNKPSKPPSTPKLTKRFIIAIDFGTTYSGAAWVTYPSDGRPRLIDQWSGGGNDRKTPTTIRYDDNSESFSWGSDVPENMPRHEWFKLRLEPTQHGEQSKLADKYPALLPPPESEVPVEKLVKDYLGALRAHAQKKLKEILLKDPLLSDREAKFQYVLTIPATWSEKTKDLTRKCGSAAGMGEPKSIKIITEPEAAALHELKARAEQHELSVNDTFVLCDAGGGTVDLISYTVKRLQPAPVIEEATSGTGGSCGSTFVNRAFGKWLKSHLGKEKAWDETVLFAAMDEFEEKVKKNFDPKRNERNYMIRLPCFNDLPEKNINKGTLGITTKQLTKIFEPVIAEVIKLVTDQISRTQGRARMVLLVGGFGQSIYLRQRLEESVPNGIRVRQGLDPLCAVVRGAALYGLQDSTPNVHVASIASRKSRHHYGVEASKEFDAAVHDSSKRFEDRFTGKSRINTMNWIIRKEESLQSSRRKTFELYYELKASNPPPTEITTKVYISSSDRAPLYSDDKTVSEFVELTADLRKIPENELNKEPGLDEELYYKLDFAIEMKCFEVVTEYALIYQGKRHNVVRKAYA